MSAPGGRLRRNLADLAGLFGVPLLAALLPWRLTLALLRRLAMSAPTFRPEAEAAWRVAKADVGSGDAVEWQRRYRLIRWVERADTGLTLARGTRWWRARVDVEGSWPSMSPQLFLTYHWGAGNWVWKLMRERGFAAHFLARRPAATDLGASRVALWYGRLRGWALRRIGSCGPLYTGGAGAAIEAAFARGESAVAMLDLPCAGTQRPREAHLLGHALQWPTRLLDLAAGSGVEATIFSCGFDVRSGRRCLRMEPLQTVDAATVIRRYAAHLEGRLREAPEFWMMWHELPAMQAGCRGSRAEATGDVPQDGARGIMDAELASGGLSAARPNRNGAS